ncbi:Arc family DNA-binding protein [Sedimenticola hydrogenitrophicus]|uniref:Arc family DNA-binding protein n=1 Tax=Sedimenticola hydrogenitrophicus TaxID=2967975 RepID=UPI0023B1BE45|nr:Arc family DNA-binding protein [Sedimenticola hydrogenitrophicus]
MSRTDPQVKVRLPAELKDYIQETAGENHRTMNAEIVFRLEQSKKQDNVNEQQK